MPFVSTESTSADTRSESAVSGRPGGGQTRPGEGGAGARTAPAPDGNGQLDRAAGTYTVREERGLIPVSQRTGVDTQTLARLNSELLGGSTFAALKPGMVLRIRDDATVADPSAAPAAPTAPPQTEGEASATAGSSAAAPTLAEVRGGAKLSEGMKGPAVAHVQKLVGVKMTGEFGADTAAAVARFQTQNGLTPAQGVVGPTTLAALESRSTEVSPDAAAQMARLVAIAEGGHRGASLGDCFAYVWRYIVKAGYGKIRNHGDAADMPSDYARNFAEYMNSGSNAKRWGLKRLSLSSPYDAPRGSIVVVGPGTPGTRHPTAGDIAVAAGGGRFINDGPNMSYGPPGRFAADGGKLLGVYVPDL